MAGVDLSARFEQIPERAKVASDQVRAVSQRREDQLRTAARSARDQSAAAADELRDNGTAAAAIDEAESAPLNAMYCRTRATALNP